MVCLCVFVGIASKFVCFFYHSLLLFVCVVISHHSLFEYISHDSLCVCAFGLKASVWASMLRCLWKVWGFTLWLDQGCIHLSAGLWRPLKGGGFSLCLEQGCSHPSMGVCWPLKCGGFTLWLEQGCRSQYGWVMAFERWWVPSMARARMHSSQCGCVIAFEWWWVNSMNSAWMHSSQCVWLPLKGGGFTLWLEQICSHLSVGVWWLLKGGEVLCC